ncbi:amino acid adenylation domain-containing protein [Streptosporangium subroseum]|uniref:Amino acid adenylation domain-containing protein n=1 Tax=Streptosporangium subroseum TaxID=106412 RepID=A0A239IZH7_9ACTN|nr:non-ribosomal peptide synthetase [Streptosporangium subroseum]SNS98990.1 amino acid adenylation domain-containing protein [Streptosporangium subroseum]
MNQLHIRKNLAEVFEARVAAAPDAETVVCGETRLSATELNTRANTLARRLTAAGAGPETPVMVLMERSTDVVVTLLAIIKAGATYIPLHPGLPPARMRWIAEETHARLLIVDPTHADHELTTHLHTLLMNTTTTKEQDATEPPAQNSDLKLAIDPDRLAYVMFTSGSTGTPKGVAITHRAITTFAADHRWHDHHRVLSHSPFAFDASTYEIWVPLLNGGTIVMAPPGPLDAATLQHTLEHEQVSAAFLTTALFNLLAHDNPHTLAAIPHLWTGGEAASPTAMHHVLHAGGTLTNVYGPTETTTFALSHPVTSPSPNTIPNAIPIGSPLDGTRAYVLDDRLRPVPAGVPGELYLAGPQLARGYLHRPALTAERFVADPHGEPGTRMYRTGDLVRRHDDGNLEFVGRADDQVKIRGFRIELGEIDTTLARHPAIAHTTTIAREDHPGDKRLVTYLVPHHPPTTTTELTEHLRRFAEETLPTYMIPTAFVILDRLPLNHNGKIDRHALPAPTRQEPTVMTQGPRTEAEELVAEVWAEVLGVDGVGVYDDFFALGGNSLLAIRVAARIRAAVNLEIPVNAVFTDPTVEKLADTVEALLIADIEEQAPHSQHGRNLG